MWPWAHLALGYLGYSLYNRGRYGHPPTGEGLIALAIATQVPDLIDKPFAYWLGVFPKGRALFHSLLFAIPLLLVVWYLARRYRSPAATGFGIGYASHIIGDFWFVLTGFDVGETTLLWPILPGPVYETNSFQQHFHELVAAFSLGDPIAAIGQYPSFYAQIGFAILVSGLWIFDGQPGLRGTVSWVVGIPNR